MPYLLDTDTVSATLLPRPNLVVVRRLAAVPPDEQFTSAITVGELTYGAVRRVRTGLQERIQAFLDGVPVLSFDSAAARRYGELKAQLEQAGTPLAEPDLRIAAIALENDLVLVTGNERHFARVPGLRLENWLT